MRHLNLSWFRGASSGLRATSSGVPVRSAGTEGRRHSTARTILGTYSDQDRHAGKGVEVRDAQASDDREKDAMVCSQVAY